MSVQRNGEFPTPKPAPLQIGSVISVTALNSRVSGRRELWKWTRRVDLTALQSPPPDHLGPPCPHSSGPSVVPSPDTPPWSASSGSQALRSRRTWPVDPTPRASRAAAPSGGLWPPRAHPTSSHHPGLSRPSDSSPPAPGCQLALPGLASGIREKLKAAEQTQPDQWAHGARRPAERRSDKSAQARLSGAGLRAAPGRGRTPGGSQPASARAEATGTPGIPRTRTRKDSPWPLSRSRAGSWAAAPACARSSFATCSSLRPARLGALTTPPPRRCRTSERSSSLGDLKVSARSPQSCHSMRGGRVCLSVCARKKPPPPTHAPPHPSQKGYVKHSWNCLAWGFLENNALPFWDSVKCWWRFCLPPYWSSSPFLTFSFDPFSHSYWSFPLFTQAYFRSRFPLFLSLLPSCFFLFCASVSPFPSLLPFFTPSPLFFFVVRPTRC